MSSLGLRVVLAAAAALAGATAIVYAATRGGEAGPSRASETSWAALAPSPLARTEVGAARIGDRVYVVGGFISSGGTTGRMVRYDISADRWRRVADLPIAVNHPGVTALGGRLYLAGGNLPGAGAGEPKSDHLYGYSPRRDRWRRLPDMPTARAALALGGTDGRLYAAGGYSESDFQLRALEIYDLRRGRWTRGPAMPTGRNHVGAAILDGELVVTGGRPGPTNGGLTTVESYDPEARRWSTLPPLRTARSGHAAAVVSGRLVVLGGEELGPGGQTIEQVEAFDAEAGAWSELPQMITPRHGVGAAARAGRIYALEGGPQPGLAYSPALEYLDVR